MKVYIKADSRNELFGRTYESLEDYVAEPFDLEDDEVQYLIAEWCADVFISFLNDENKDKNFWPDDIRYSSSQISFDVIEGEDNKIGTFRCDLNFYDGEAESYDDVEYLLIEEMKDWVM